ncbi:MAG: 4Fe-4S dicluster domain-containing protein [Bacillota bacterium]
MSTSLASEAPTAPKAVRLVRAADLGRWLDALSAGSRVWAPQSVGGRPRYRELTPGREGRLDLEAVRTVDSPKAALLPQTEPLLAYRRAKDPGTGRPSLDLTPVPPAEPVVLFGVRPCDAAAVELLDGVFLTGDFVDEHYKARREKSVIVTVACSAPDRACFCTSFGLSPGSTREADVVLYGRSGPGPKAEPDAYYCVAYSDRGEALLTSEASRSAGVVEPPADEGQKLEDTVAAFRNLPTPLAERVGRVDVVDKLDGLFESPYWEKVAARCLGCGTCTFVCPTCFCFGVADCAAGGRGVRFRYWDSCKFPHFLRMAGGHDPRPHKKHRTRQRFMHKLNYHYHRYGRYLCVGCGRCVESCPVGLHLPQVADEVRGLEG